MKIIEFDEKRKGCVGNDMTASFIMFSPKSSLFVAFSEWIIYRAMPVAAPWVIAAGLGLLVVGTVEIFLRRNL